MKRLFIHPGMMKVWPISAKVNRRDGYTMLGFGCSHSRTTFPLTPNRKSPPRIVKGMYVACLACGKEMTYDWVNMRIEKTSPASTSIRELFGITKERKVTLRR